jgi:hypothetical protein
MTHKEAADQLRDLIQDRRSLMTDEEHSDIYKRDIEALQFGIDAIEQAEKGDTANWVICCDGYYPFCSVCGEATQHMTPYCPNCGYRLVTRKHGDD